MKFSAWSLLVISACSLVFAASASAHLSVSPAKASPATPIELTFSVPNEDDPHGITHVTITAPAAFALDDGEAKAGWTQTRPVSSISWAGGVIPLNQFGTFVVRGTTPSRSGTVVFGVRIAGRSGKPVSYHVGLEVVAPSTDWGKPALFVAIGAALLALGAFFVALTVWLRSPR